MGTWSIGGIEARQRLQDSVRSEARGLGVPEPSAEQVAAVLHALADYEIMAQAVTWSPGDMHPIPTSLCRFLHDYADLLKGREVDVPVRRRRTEQPTVQPDLPQ